MSNVGVMPCRFVMALFVLLGGFFMVLRSFLMMFGCLLMMFSGFVFMMYSGRLLMLGGLLDGSPPSLRAFHLHVST